MRCIMSTVDKQIDRLNIGQVRGRGESMENEIHG